MERGNPQRLTSARGLERFQAKHALGLDAGVGTGSRLRKRVKQKTGATVLIQSEAFALVLPFWLGYGLPDFRAAVGAFIDKVDLGHAPMRLDLSHIHRKQANAAGTDNRGRLEDVVMLDIGWHVGSPSQRT
jgi:hypothetical protein